MYQKKCNTNVFNIGHDIIISRLDQVHNHENDLNLLNRQVISVIVKRKAVENIAEKPAKLIHSAINQNTATLDTLSTSDINNIRKSVYNVRKKVLPPLSKIREEIFDVLDNILQRTSKGENF